MKNFKSLKDVFHMQFTNKFELHRNYVLKIKKIILVDSLKIFLNNFFVD